MIIKSKQMIMLMVCKIILYNNVSNYFILLLFNSNIHFIDEDEMYNNPNLHSEEQDKLKLPDSIDLDI